MEKKGNNCVQLTPEEMEKVNGGTGFFQDSMKEPIVSKEKTKYSDDERQYNAPYRRNEEIRILPVP